MTAIPIPEIHATQVPPALSAPPESMPAVVDAILRDRGGFLEALRDVVSSAGHALADLGRLMLAFTPALAFLVATSTHRFATGFYGHLALLGAAFFALRAMYGRLSARDSSGFGPRELAGFLLFAGWSCIALAIGWRFFIPLVFG